MFMKKVRILSSVLALLFFSVGTGLSASIPEDDFKMAENLYGRGLYDEARTLFESVPKTPMSEGYVVLCALKSRSIDYDDLKGAYERKYGKTVLTSEIRLENARLLFDDGRYAEAGLEFSKVASTAIPKQEMPEYVFKCAFCEYSLGRYQEAMQFLTLLDALEYSQYSAPGQYIAGLIHYNHEKFAEAESCFNRAVTDSRFKELSEFYIVDCEFSMKNYEFAVREGERLYSVAPKGRKERLARRISVSSLVLGDSQKAREYYEGSVKSDMARSDYFYAGSVMYSVRDYRAAIENFSKMTDRGDSLGQIANYHLGNSYLKVRNQVAAMAAFKDASEVKFDPQITEDALFNYAKLAFDLNKDTKGFSQYIQRYSTSSKGAQLYGYMALAALYDRDYVAAVEAYDNIDVLSPDMQNNYTKANFLRAEELFTGASYRDAIPYYKATAYYLPKSDRLAQMARYRMAEANYMTGNYQEAEKGFTELYNASAMENLIQGKILPYNVGYSCFKQKKYDEAARWFDKYIQSGNPLYREDAMTRRADCDFGRKDYKEAVNSYQKVLTEFFSPDDIYPYYQQAISYGLAGDKKRKVSTLLHIEDASPDAPLYAEAYFELGKAQMDNGNNNDAIRSFTHLKNTVSDAVYKVRATIGLGMVYRNMSNYEKALECYKSVVESMPGSEYAEESMLAIESIYHKMKKPEKFLEYVESNELAVKRTEAEKEKMYFSTAEQLYLSGNYQQAIATLRKFMDAYPQSPDMPQARFYLAESYRESGEKEKACAEYAKVKNAESTLSFVEMSKLRYAQLSFDLQRYVDAYNGYLSLFETTNIESNRAAAREGMMLSAYRSKDYEKAVMAATSVISDADTDKDVKVEAKYIKAKSLLATSKRNDAMKLFAELGATPSTPRGAESKYLLIQNLFDTANFDSVESEVYDFSQKAGNQSYWLAKAYLVLGDSFVERGSYEQAKATYESIGEGYQAPSAGDDIADNVKKRLDRLAGLMEK